MRPGFVNAPVTKFFAVMSVSMSVIAGLTKSVAQMNISTQGMARVELWRIITSQFVFTHPGEIIFGVYLLYYFRMFERHYGSSKWSAFAFCTCAMSTALQVALVTFLSSPAPGLSLSPGPYGLIFASFVPFALTVPSSARFSILGLSLTDKSFVFLAGLQVMLSSSPVKCSLFPGLCGLVAGSIYHANVLGIREWRFPEPVRTLASKTLGSLIGYTEARPVVSGWGLPRSTREPIPPRPDVRPAGQPAFQGTPAGGQASRAAGGGAGGAFGGMAGAGMGMGGGGGPFSPMVQLPEADVETLMSLGFERDAAVRALIAGGGDIHMATEILLSGM